MTYRSHTPEVFRAALEAGSTGYRLETGNAGEDDMLLAAPGESRESVLHDVLDHFDLDALPEGWTLEEVA